MDKTQLKNLIDRILKSLDLYSEHAVNLLLGTCAQESAFGTYIRQLGKGPALGIFQMEPATFNDIENNFLRYKPDLKVKIKQLSGISEMSPEQLEYNLVLAACMARVHYLRVPEALPTDLTGYARYWKKYYNTHLGKGTEAEFINNYKKYVL